MENKEVLLRVRNVKTYFPIRKGVVKRTVGYVRAVDDISLDVYRGETLGLVGESGCGKTTLGKSILQLVPVTDGSMEYRFQDGWKDLRKLSRKEMDNARQKIQIVFQDPYSSLNPAFTIYGSLEDPLIKFGMKNRQERIERIAGLLEDVNLPREYMTRYPNEFSGGQRQRIGIARALSVNPELIICDEAVSALDVSIQAQVLSTKSVILLPAIWRSLRQQMDELTDPAKIRHEISGGICLPAEPCEQWGSCSVIKNFFTR